MITNIHKAKMQTGKMLTDDQFCVGLQVDIRRGAGAIKHECISDDEERAVFKSIHPDWPGEVVMEKDAEDLSISELKEVNEIMNRFHIAKPIERALVRRADELGYVSQMSYSQVGWLDNGLLRYKNKLAFNDYQATFVTDDGYTLKMELDEIGTVCWTDGDMTFDSEEKTSLPVDETGNVLDGELNVNVPLSLTINYRTLDAQLCLRSAVSVDAPVSVLSESLQFLTEEESKKADSLFDVQSFAYQMASVPFSELEIEGEYENVAYTLKKPSEAFLALLDTNDEPNSTLTL